MANFVLYFVELRRITNINNIGQKSLSSTPGNPRLLRHRRGCRGVIRQLELYSETGNEFMACSELDAQGYLGKISTIQQQQNIDFSQNFLLIILNFRLKHHIILLLFLRTFSYLLKSLFSNVL